MISVGYTRDILTTAIPEIFIATDQFCQPLRVRCDYGGENNI